MSLYRATHVVHRPREFYLRDPDPDARRKFDRDMADHEAAAAARKRECQERIDARAAEIQAEKARVRHEAAVELATFVRDNRPMDGDLHRRVFAVIDAFGVRS